MDLVRLRAIVENLKLLSREINTANVPDIKIASVELGPVLRWIMDMLRSPSDNKIVIFDESSAALIEGPIISHSKIVLELDPLTEDQKSVQRVRS
jgi:hypothetical protein